MLYRSIEYIANHKHEVVCINTNRHGFTACMQFIPYSDVVVRATMYPQRNFTLNLNSDDNVTFTCVTKGGYPVWAVGRAACLEKDGCVSNQLQLEDHKHGSYAMTKGWMVEDLAYNESIIMITKKTRMLHGDLKIFCLAFSTEYYYETPPRTPQYYIFSYGKLNFLSPFFCMCLMCM